MINTWTQKPLRVSNEGTAGPYLMVPYSQVEEIIRLLTEHAVRYTVEENVVSLNGSPEIATVNFGRGADPERVQAVLDGAR